MDYFVVPTTPDRKQQIDTIRTVRELREREVPADKIIVVANNLYYLDSSERDLAHIRTAARTGEFYFARVPIVRDALFSVVERLSESIFDLAKESADCRALTLAETDMDERKAYAARFNINGAAKTVAENLAQDWQSIGLFVEATA